MVWQIVFGVLIPFFGTVLGACCVLLLKGELNRRLQRSMAGFAAGVMVAASVWSLLIPAIEKSAKMGKLSFLPAAIGYSIGFLFLLILDFVIPQPEELTIREKETKGGMRKIRMMVLAVTLHNIPEGMAVGVAFAAVLVEKNPAMVSAAMALSVGIAVQNFPEGAIVSMPLASAGEPKGKALLWGIFSGAVELLGAGIMLLASVWLAPAMPWFLSFAAGAMFYVVVEELIPEMEDGVRNKIGAISFAAGFLIMMILDVLLG
ncbi:MAG: ZIP family metal transporter [Ruminococcaceae bacterium]|nr:ZIP family metal transporter [Oscillospiraceae bacterium]